MRRHPVLVVPDATVDSALEAADACGVRHLLVAEVGELHGVVCVCDLWRAPGADPVFSRIAAESVTIAPAAPAALARLMMIRSDVDCLPVLRSGQLVGIVTRRDLRDIGLPVPETRCTYCKGTRHVRRVGVDDPLACFECRRSRGLSMAPFDRR
ncbi:MAG: CBS domain-containing protein [Deltaproteobacteria bacterium]|nr:CBS domain-containing protein [Deltaproteobacteria bacterium]